MTTTLLLLLKISVGIIILAIGMDSTLRESPPPLASAWPIIPLGAGRVRTGAAGSAGTGQNTDPTAGVEIGLLVLAAVSAGAPLFSPRKLLNIGDGAYIFSLVVTSTLLAIMLVPVWLAVLGPSLATHQIWNPRGSRGCSPNPFAAPLALGMLVRWLFRRWPNGSGIA